MLGVLVSVSTLYLGAGLGPTRAVGLTKVARDPAPNRGYDLASTSTTPIANVTVASTVGTAPSAVAIGVPASPRAVYLPQKT